VPLPFPNSLSLPGFLTESIEVGPNFFLVLAQPRLSHFPTDLGVSLILLQVPFLSLPLPLSLSLDFCWFLVLRTLQNFLQLGFLSLDFCWSLVLRTLQNFLQLGFLVFMLIFFFFFLGGFFLALKLIRYFLDLFLF
jgi:hypothetical protein